MCLFQIFTRVPNRSYWRSSLNSVQAYRVKHKMHWWSMVSWAFTAQADGDAPLLDGTFRFLVVQTFLYQKSLCWNYWFSALASREYGWGNKIRSQIIFLATKQKWRIPVTLGHLQSIDWIGWLNNKTCECVLLADHARGSRLSLYFSLKNKKFHSTNSSQRFSCEKQIPTEM